MPSPRGYRSIALVVSLMALPAFAGEPTTPDAERPPDVPGGSFVTMSDALRGEVFSKLGAIAKDKHSCTKLQIIDTRTRSVKGKVRLGSDGQLLAGTITESWKVDFCGTRLSFTVVLTPPVEGSGGVTVSGRD